MDRKEKKHYINVNSYVLLKDYNKKKEMIILFDFAFQCVGHSY